MTELKNKIAVITGGGGGIGSAVAQKLAGNGMKIALLGGNNIEKLNRTADGVKKYSDCLVLPGDLTDMELLYFISEALLDTANAYESYRTPSTIK